MIKRIYKVVHAIGFAPVDKPLNLLKTTLARKLGADNKPARAVQAGIAGAFMVAGGAIVLTAVTGLIATPVAGVMLVSSGYVTLPLMAVTAAIHSTVYAVMGTIGKGLFDAGNKHSGFTGFVRQIFKGKQGVVPAQQTDPQVLAAAQQPQPLDGLTANAEFNGAAQQPAATTDQPREQAAAVVVRKNKR